MTTPMMRSRQRGNPCRVQGHGSRCEVSDERSPRERAQEKREWQSEVAAVVSGASGLSGGAR
jgi:hypothetical protein